MNWLIINNDTQKVDNVTEWDGEAEWSPPEGYSVEKCDDNPGVWIGWQRINGVWTAPTPAAPTVPHTIPMNKARKELAIRGLLATIQGALEADTSTQGKLNLIDWEYATAMVRTSPLVEGLGIGLGLTDAQMDAMFIEASNLP